MERYGTYGQGDYKSKEWSVYDRKLGILIYANKFKTKIQAKTVADKMNQEKYDYPDLPSFLGGAER